VTWKENYVVLCAAYGLDAVSRMTLPQARTLLPAAWEMDAIRQKQLSKGTK
jgi:hypothetical protein